jgi:hypothetical protein
VPFAPHVSRSTQAYDVPFAPHVSRSTQSNDLPFAVGRRRLSPTSTKHAPHAEFGQGARCVGGGTWSTRPIGEAINSPVIPTNRPTCVWTGCGQIVEFQWSTGAQRVTILCSAQRKFSAFKHLGVGRTTSCGLNLPDPNCLGYPVRSVLKEIPCA